LCSTRTLAQSWHINKRRFSDERLKAALNWMRENSILPKGNKAVTKIKNDTKIPKGGSSAKIKHAF
jgi:hypothetical protein